MEYKCERCGYTTNYKHSLINHLHKQTPCSTCCSNKPRDELITVLKAKQYNDKTYNCTYCGNKFNNASSRTRHHKICKHKPDEKYDELKEEIAKLKKDLEDTKNNQKQSINITNTYNNININNFGRENIEHLPLEFLTSCFMMKDIPALIENIYFDEEYPENQTIKLKSLKNKTFLVHDSGEWIIKPTNRVLDELVNKGQTILKRHYRSHPQQVQEDMSEDEIDEVIQWLTQIWNENVKIRSAIKNDLMAIFQSYRKEI